MKPPRGGYFTQCDSGGQIEKAAFYNNFTESKPCLNSTRLEKPSKWRCEACTAKHGPLVKCPELGRDGAGI